MGLVGGCLLEFAGYIGRLLMHTNPFHESALRLQIICLILAPSFIAAGIDLTLKHLVIRFGPEYSLIRPALYTWLFISLDIFSIILQAAGGGLAASGLVHPELLEIGNNVILAGIGVQVFQLVAFGVVSVYYAGNVMGHLRKYPEKRRPLPSRLKLFILMVTIAYAGILLRCVYR